MQLLIYAPTGTPSAQKLLNQISFETSASPINIFESLHALTLRLRKPISTSLLAVLLPKDPQELTALIQMRHLLRLVRIVLILPNREMETISNSHILRPRYIGYSDSDMSDVAAVLNKMAQTEKQSLRQAV
jgi:hypothetical protein